MQKGITSDILTQICWESSLLKYLEICDNSIDQFAFQSALHIFVYIQVLKAQGISAGASGKKSDIPTVMGNNSANGKFIPIHGIVNDRQRN